MCFFEPFTHYPMVVTLIFKYSNFVSDINLRGYVLFIHAYLKVKTQTKHQSLKRSQNAKIKKCLTMCSLLFMCMVVNKQCKYITNCTAAYEIN